MEIKAENLSVKIGNKMIIRDINAEVKNKEFVGIIGPNGSGKSTFLKTIYRVLKPNKGIIWIDGKSLEAITPKESAQKLGVMTQMNNLNFDFTVEEVVLMGRTPHKKLIEQDNENDYLLAHESLLKTGMADFAVRNFNTLSGGEQQRVMMARVLTQEPKALILDEPTNHLDIQYQIQLLRTVKSLKVEIFAAMHDLNLAATYCDKLYVMNKGKVVTFGVPEEILTEKLIKDVFGVQALIVEIPSLNRKNIVFIG